MDHNLPPNPPDEKPSVPRHNPWLFFAFIFFPSAITLMLGLLMSSDELTVALNLMALAFIMSLIAGGLCRHQLMIASTLDSPGKKFFASIGYFIACSLGAGALCFGGCLIAIG